MNGQFSLLRTGFLPVYAAPVPDEVELAIVTMVFDANDPDRLLSVLAKYVAMPTIEPLGAEQLSQNEHGQFDLIFSVNVLEHMHPLQRNLDAMAAVLAPGGLSVPVARSLPCERRRGIANANALRALATPGSPQARRVSLTLDASGHESFRARHFPGESARARVFDRRVRWEP